MKKLLSILLLVGFLLVSTSAFAITNYNNFTGYSDYWHPFGNPNTATYGETFTVPTNGDNVLLGGSFYLGSPYVAGDIQLGIYLATWTGLHAGTLIGQSGLVDYANTGNFQLSYGAAVPPLVPGGSYVIFLSVSQYYGNSSGEAYVVPGSPTIPGGNFVWYNNGGDFNALFNSNWDATGEKPDWAITLQFGPGPAPIPATLPLVGAGIIGLLVARQRKK